MNHPGQVDYNWLVHKIVREELGLVFARYARGTLVDIGCGRKPYADLLHDRIERYVGVDHADSQHDPGRADVVATAYATTLPVESADTVLSTFVLEHLEHPLEAAREAARVLRPGGCLILTAPMFWHLHEEPRDFFRFTSYGLRSLSTQAGLEVVELRPLSGFAVTFAQEACYRLREASSKVVRLLARPAATILQSAAWAVHRSRLDRDGRFTWAWLLVARKPAAS